MNFVIILLSIYLCILANCFNCDSNVFSVGGKCINSNVLNNFDPKKVSFFCIFFYFNYSLFLYVMCL